MPRLACLIVACLAAGCMDRPTSSTAVLVTTKPEEPAKADAVTDIDTAQPMLAEFRENVIAASRKWGGKRVRFWNRVTEIGQDKGGDYVRFYNLVKLYAAKEAVTAFGKLRRDDEVIVEGVVESYRGADADLEVTLTDGRFVEYKAQAKR